MTWSKLGKLTWPLTRIAFEAIRRLIFRSGQKGVSLADTSRSAVILWAKKDGRGNLTAFKIEIREEKKTPPTRAAHAKSNGNPAGQNGGGIA